MNWVVYLFGSGLIFFWGVGAICTGVLFAVLPRPRWLAKSASVVVIAGLILVGLSAAPLPYWYYAIAASLSVVWLFSERMTSEGLARYKRWFCASMIVIWLAGIVLELPCQFAPRPVIKDRSTLFVIGDSFTAGMGDRQMETWPKLLAQTRMVEVQDFSRPGATARSAIDQANRLPSSGGIVLLEIGGNDVLSSRLMTEFEHELDQLLTKVCAPDRVVLMLELPLPPFHNGYGRMQRRLAAKHGVYLIPKRVFAEALAAQGATLDSIHLSKSGHEQMAERVWALIQPRDTP